MKYLIFFIGLVIGIVAAYGVVAADLIELPFLEPEEVVVEEPVEVEVDEEEEENLLIEGYSYDPGAGVIPFVDVSYSFSDEFLAMLEETGGVVVGGKLPYTMDDPETVYIAVGYELENTEAENRTDFFEYNLTSNEYTKKFEYVSDSYVAVPRGVDGSKLVFSKSAVDFGPPICGSAWDMWEQFYFDLADSETVATEYELPARLQEEVDLNMTECKFLEGLTGFEQPGE